MPQEAWEAWTDKSKDWACLKFVVAVREKEFNKITTRRWCCKASLHIFCARKINEAGFARSKCPVTCPTSGKSTPPRISSQIRGGI